MTIPTEAPANRVRVLRTDPVRTDGDYVLYWMFAFRRTHWNFALDHALARARELDRPLVVLEPLRCGYRWASDRFHRFVLEGMAENRRRFDGSPVRHHAWVEEEPGSGSGLLEALAERASVVVTDDAPTFFLPRMVRAATEKIEARLEAVDSNGFIPLSVPDRTLARAYDFRRFLQRSLPPALLEAPHPDPLSDLDLPSCPELSAEVLRRWPEASDEMLAGEPSLLAGLPLDHEVGPVPQTAGGTAAGLTTWRTFLEDGLDRYGQASRRLEERRGSGLSPYLHFGHVGVHQLLHDLADREDWDPSRVASSATGAREGWWGMSAGAEAFLDQLVTWRELGLCNAWKEGPHDDPGASWEALPAWARASLDEHASDPREHLYSFAELEEACTHDELWNAAQRELRQTGTIHGYLRMLWGKRVLEWTANPRESLRILFQLNDRWALDGRDPNSASGITWCFGRYDRAWGPERPIYGKVRYMSSANTRRKMDVSGYLARFGD